MKKMIISLLFVAVMAILSGCMNGSATVPEKQTAVCLVLGDHLNSKSVKINNPEVMEAVDEAVRSGGVLFVIQVDGEPDKVFASSYCSVLKSAASNPQKFERDVKQMTLKAENAIISVTKANDPEADVMKAIDMGIRAFSDYPDMEKKMIIIDSGLSTTGVLDFNNNLLNADPELLAEELFKRHEIPDFSGISEIKWFQLGDTADEQPELSGNQRETLKNIWTSIVKVGGGELEIKKSLPGTARSSTADYPAVTCVSITQEAPIKYDPSEPEVKVVSTTSVTVVSDNDQPEPEETLIKKDDIKVGLQISEEVLGFKGDSDEYLLSDDEVKAILTPVAEYLSVYPETELLIIGTTAGDKATDYSYNLSEKRAAAVKKSLVAMGCDADKLTVVGMACNDPWHISGAGTSGPLASANRKVVLLGKDSESAREMLKGGIMS